MTSEPTSEAPRDVAAPPVGSGGGRGDGAAALHIRFALAFLAVSTAMLALAAAGLVFPDMSADTALLSYGRLFPAALDLLVFGWLTLGLIGAAYYILPRVSGTPLRHAPTALAGGWLLAAAVVAGTVSVLLGGNEGRQYLEYPLWVDAVIVVGLLLVARVVTGHIAGPRRSESLAPPDWYFGAAVVWLLLAHVAGSIPGLKGVNVTLQVSFYRGALFGLWLAAAGLGVVYYLASSVSNREPGRISQLGVYAFWSTGFVFAMASAARLTYTTAPDWLETIGTVFGIALLVPVAIVAVDITTMLRTTTPGSGTPAYLLTGMGAFALFPLVNLGLGWRSTNVIVGFTDWVYAVDLLALLGIFSMWLLAFLRRVTRHAGSGTGHLVVSAAAVIAAVGALMVSGVQTGLTWVASANDGTASVGDGFEASAGGRAGHAWVIFVSLGVFALAQIWFALRARFAFEPLQAAAAEGAGEEPSADEPEEPDTSGEPADEGEDEEEAFGGLPRGTPLSLGRIRTGAVGVLAVVALFLFVLPILESAHRDATLLAEAERDYAASSQVADGREVYVAEGCWYCHTQEVREIVPDVGLGPVALPGDYALEDPPVTGVSRRGPDLMFAGSRDLDAAAIAAILKDPRSVRSWSTMPTHAYLSDRDLSAVAAYLAALTVYQFE